MIAFEPYPERPIDEGMAMARDWLQSRKIPDQYAVVETVMSNIDRTALAALIAKYALRQEFTGAWKYLDLPYWLARAARNAAVLGLERRSPCNVLDLGSGGGQTLAICNALGHSSVGLEMPSAANDRTKTGLDYPFPIYDDLEILLGTHREFQLILPGVRLKSFNRKFDVVTAYLAFFHYVYFDNTLEI